MKPQPNPSFFKLVFITVNCFFFFVLRTNIFYILKRNFKNLSRKYTGVLLLY